MSASIHDEHVIWRPGTQTIESALITQFTREAERVSGRTFVDYFALWQWSIDAPERFWSLVWSFCGVIGARGERVVVDRERMPGAHWFPDARLNYAQNLLDHATDTNADALVFWGEDKVVRRMAHGELRREVAVMAAALRAQGVTVGDRVAAYLPNMPETIIAMLAAASLGAIFTSTSPDFGVQGVLDRFGQTQPKVLFAVDGYWYNGKSVDCTAKVREMVAALPSLERVVFVSYLNATSAPDGVRNAQRWDEFVAPHVNVTALSFAQLPFEHPLFILYSSGTTGVPKCIVHGAGGTLLQHLKEYQLHNDVRARDRFFYFTTCGWTMWNILATGLAAGATLLLYDGSPFLHDGRILFELAQVERMTQFGTSAKFIDAIAKTGLKPREQFDLASLRAIFSTGSPLVPESYDAVYRDWKTDVHLSSMSGGTDICSAFVLGVPTLPVRRGEIQCAGLGMAVDVFDDDGKPLRGAKGELVCTQSFPCLPISFWNDADGAAYHAAYFDHYHNIWRHGDFAEITPHGGMIIYGRSDATLNPGGVRIGTAEIYRQVEKLEEVVESIVIGQQWPPEAPLDVRVVLFVRLRDGRTLDNDLVERIRRVIRDNTTPRHVPAKVLQVSDIPRTKSGKIVELAVRNVVHDRAVKNREALANPEALELFRNRIELRS